MKNGERAFPERRATPREPAEPPRRTGAAAWLHHGLRAAVLLGVSIAVYLCFPGAQTSDVPVLEQGVVAREEVIAEVAFTVPKTQEELRREQEEAARGVPPVFVYRPAAGDSVVGGVRQFFAAVEQGLRTAVPGQEQLAVRAALDAARVPTTLGAIEVLMDASRRFQLQAATELAVREQFTRGVAAASPERAGFSAVQVRGLPGGERLIPADSVFTADQFYRAAQQRLPAESGADAAELQRLLLVRWFRPSLAEDERATRAARARAGAAVDSVKERILAGQRIVGAREQVTAREVERLRAYQHALQGQRVEGQGARGALRVVGAVLFNALLLMIVGALLKVVRPRIYDDTRAVLFLAMLVVAVAGIASPIARFELPPELIPIPFAVLMAAVLWGGRLALVFALVLALLLGGQQPFIGLTVPFEAAVAGAAAAFGLRLAQRRLQAWGLIAVIAVAYAGAVLSVGLLRARGLDEIARSMLWGAVNGTASTLLAIGFLPLAEWFTRVTTNQTLMELADPKHPLLQRLSMEAPGTYAHTISVANLAEAVCNAIGANALLARVGVYYHDIGKITKPLYFIENQPRGRNPHDKLKPAMSAAVVRSHVVEGLRLAAEYRLPQAVKDFIAQHHGTQPISFFLDQARAADPGAKLNPADFAYGGPRPQTREVAVVMMADSVESAARVLQDPSPPRIRDLVARIVDAKIAAGQLDECPLTLREINVTREVLAKVLSGMYHQRLDYPAPAGNGGGNGSDAAPAAPERVAAPAREGVGNG
ncbi:HD family phosphohydrolase [Longimicrobium sp.]|uniref:HD family phosphohydrolase n=1 Tax=Longimicrobium sp. TaxID=2029185 RepID=UPI003B3B40CC